MKDTSHTLQVVRRNFFSTPKGTLRFTEHSPEAIEHEDFECNCTKSVVLRPPGKPDQITQDIALVQEAPDYKLSFSLSSLWYDFRFLPEIKVAWSGKPEKRHAYFIFDCNNIKNSIRIEITQPGYGRIGCFFGNLYFGNKVDISTLMNGHSTSRIIKLKEIGPHQVWAHGCNFGKEAFGFLRECAETNRWRQAQDDVSEIRTLAAPFTADLKSPVDALRQQVEVQADLVALARTTGEWLWSIVANLKQTELFRCCDEVEKAIKG